jgi:hypothetical protein
MLSTRLILSAILVIFAVCSSAYGQEAWDIATPLPEGVYNTIAYVSFDNIEAKTDETIINNPYAGRVSWPIIEHLQKKMQIHQFVYAQLLHRTVNGVEFNGYDPDTISDYENSEGTADVGTVVDRIWIIDFSPTTGWSEDHITPYSNQYGKIGELSIPRQSENSSDNRFYYLMLDERLCIANNKRAIKAVLKANMDGSSIIYSDRFYFLKEFFRHYKFYWSVSDERPGFELEFLRGKLKNLTAEQMDPYEFRLNKLVGGLHYLDFGSEIEYGEGTIFASAEIAEEYVGIWKEHLKEFVPYDAKEKSEDSRMFTPKLGLIEGSVVNTVQLSYGDVFFDIESEKESQ